MSKPEHLLVALVMGYALTYCVSFKSIIGGEAPIGFFLLFLVINSVIFLAALKYGIGRKLNRGETIGVRIIFFSTLILHISSWLLGRALGPTQVIVSDNPSVNPLLLPNQFLVNANILLLVIIFVSALIAAYLIERSQQQKRQYVYYGIFILVLYIANILLLPVVNIAYMLVTWS